jgi:superfamily I DNA and/or RNA helicase
MSSEDATERAEQEAEYNDQEEDQYIRTPPTQSTETSRDLSEFKSWVQDRKITDVESEPSETKIDYQTAEEREFKAYIREIIEAIPEQFEDADEYKQIFGAIIEVLIENEELIAKRSPLTGVHIDWGESRTQGSFNVPDNKRSYYKRGNVRISCGRVRVTAQIQENTRDEGTVYVETMYNMQDLTGPYDIQLVPNLAALSMQQEALDKFDRIKPGLKEAILGQHYQNCRGSYPLFDEDLDETQRDAARHAVENTLTIIQGPPGTGKTRVAVSIVKHKLLMDPRAQILVAAPSNNAADNLAVQLKKVGVDFVRVISKKVQMTSVGDMTSTAIAARLSTNARKVEESAVIGAANVIVCTCSMALCRRLEGKTFSFVLIDEATQATEPEVLTTLVSGTEQLVLIGDQMQLGPTVLLEGLLEKNYGVSLYERLWKTAVKHDRKMLIEQYRMHPQIADFPNRRFYDGRLRTRLVESMMMHKSVRHLWRDFRQPRLFQHVNGYEMICKTGVSYRNCYESQEVKQLAEQLKTRGINPRDIGVITFYQGQVQEIKTVLGDSRIEVSTVDGFQGKEKDFIILSCVRSNIEIGVGFIGDTHRLCVALTRARRGLMIIGDEVTLMESEPWRALLEDLRRRGSFKKLLTS